MKFFILFFLTFDILAQEKIVSPFDVDVFFFTNYTSKNLIGEQEDYEKGYLPVEKWSNQEAPYLPKKIDVLINIYNSEILELNKVDKLENWLIIIDLEILASKPTLGNTILDLESLKNTLLKKEISSKDFKSYKYDILLKDIDIENFFKYFELNNKEIRGIKTYITFYSKKYHNKKFIFTYYLFNR